MTAHASAMDLLGVRLIDVSGIYVHVPFCAADCAYCVFSREVPADRGAVTSYLDALAVETHHWRMRAGDVLSPETVYVGGGTPTYLTPDEIRVFGAHLRDLCRFESVAEFTIEANPESVDEDRLAAWMDLGVTRISIGAQSNAPHTLAFLGRTHDWGAVERAVGRVRRTKLAVSLDVIYGIPGQSHTEWTQGLEAVFGLAPDHVSAYGLTFEEGSHLSRRRAEGLIPGIDDEAQRRAYDELVKRALDRGFDRYEISNFARPGQACRHNLGYWRRTSYLGLGPSAHSFIEPVRLRNHARRPRWEARLGAGQGPVADVERLDDAARVTETLMRLRTAEGVPLDALPFRGPGFMDRVATLTGAGLVHVESGWLRLTADAFFLCDGITSDLMVAWEQDRPGAGSVATETG